MSGIENSQRILIVDDMKENLMILNDILKAEYAISVALDGDTALELATGAQPPDLILLDIMMPKMDGYDVCRQLKSNMATRDIPVIFITSRSNVEDEARGLELGAVDYIVKPLSPPIVKARVKTHLALYDQNRDLERRVKERTFELSETRLEIIRRLGRAGEYRDNETGLHVIRMSKYSQLIALAYGVAPRIGELILNTSPMHDIGKIGIPDKILLKPGKLDDKEWEIMRRHTSIGAKIIGRQSSELMQTARVAALTHHEKWNGTGYPRGLSGKSIPLVGRVLALADVFDALTSVRPYKEPWPVEKALDLMESERDKHFESAMVDSFFKALPEILKVKDRYSDKVASPL